MNIDVKKVLSIDMDFSVWRSLELYNDQIGRIRSKGTQFWDDLEEEIHIDEFLRFDEEYFKFIKSLLSSKAMKLKPEDIFFAKDHDMILEFLCADEKKIGEQYIIYNVDHHHDIYYGIDQKHEAERFDYASIGSWVYYLGIHEKVDKYYWIADAYAKFFPREEMSNIDFPCEFTGVEEGKKLLSEADFDYIFLCLSPEYFPAKYWDRFQELMQMLNKMKKREYDVWEEPYCKDGKTRHILR